VDSSKVDAVKQVWTTMERDGMSAGVEALLAVCHPGVELRPYFADGRTLRGADEIRAYFTDREASGASLHASPWSFEEHSDEVVVSGFIRVQRDDGSIADAQLRWCYRFRDDLIDHAQFVPLEAAVAQ
jgi:hypothetical protein